MYTKIIKSGDIIEKYEFQRTPYHVQGSRKPRSSGRYKRGISRRADNVRRQRKMFYRLVASNLVRAEVPFLLTLTMVEVVRVADAFRIFTRCFARLRRFAGKDFCYIAVPEFQTRGAVHFHVIVWGLSSILKNERQDRTIQRFWQRGFVDCLETDGSLKLAGYLAGYLSDALYDVRLLGQKAYVCSRNALRPVSLPSRTFSDSTLSQVIFGGVDNLDLHYKSDFDTLWLGRCSYLSYIIRKEK